MEIKRIIVLLRKDGTDIVYFETALPSTLYGFPSTLYGVDTVTVQCELAKGTAEQWVVDHFGREADRIINAA